MSEDQSKPQDMKVYTFDIEYTTAEFSANPRMTNIGYRFMTGSCGYSMEDFHCGMPDLEYDFFVPDDFGKETE